VWISGHSDYEVNDIIYNKYKFLSNKWFTTNKNCRDPSIEAIPLGHGNHCDDSLIHKTLGNLDQIFEIMQTPRKLISLCYMNFAINTYPQERQLVYDLFKDKDWVIKDHCIPDVSSRKKFLTNIRNSKFVLCPRGNGIDTHRLWETLYLGSIPIVKRHLALENFKELPILWIDEWNTITEDFLSAEYERIMGLEWNLVKLKFEYWAEKINNSYKKQKYAFVLSHNGLGDNITNISAVKFLQNYYHVIYFLCKDIHNENVSLFFNDYVVTIPIDSSKNEITECKKILDKIKYADIFVSGSHKSYMNSRITHPDLLTRVKDNEGRSIKYPHIYDFYNDIGLDLEIYFNFFNIESSNLSLKYYNDIKDYKIVFMHTMASNKEINLDYIINLYINNDEYIIICANKNIYDNSHKKYEIVEKYINIKLAHYIDIIKNAEIIHVIDSCFSCIVYPLLICNKLKSVETIIHER
jgi:hypothetical protein